MPFTQVRDGVFCIFITLIMSIMVRQKVNTQSIFDERIFIKLNGGRILGRRQSGQHQESVSLPRQQWHQQDLSNLTILEL